MFLATCPQSALTPKPDPEARPQASVYRILSLHLSLANDSTRCSTPSSVWSIPLFLAGLSTDDVIYRAWIEKRLTAAEAWGQSFGKMRLLLQDIWRREREEGHRVDVKEVMEASTGCFVL